jgi:hypothetical protein
VFREAVKNPLFTAHAVHTPYGSALYAVRDGQALMAISFGGDGYAALEAGFAMPYVRRKVFDRTAFTMMLPVYRIVNGMRITLGDVELVALGDVYADVPEIYADDAVELRLLTPASLNTPVVRGDSAARIQLFIRNVPVGEVDLRAGEMTAVAAPFDTGILFYDVEMPAAGDERRVAEARMYGEWLQYGVLFGLTLVLFCGYKVARRIRSRDYSNKSRCVPVPVGNKINFFYPSYKPATNRATLPHDIHGEH